MKFNFDKIPKFLEVDLESSQVWHWFNIIRQIPRKSKNEKQIREYIISLVKEKEYEFIVDKGGNLIVKISGLGKNVVALQAHLDMVCEKDSKVNFDFNKDKINLVEEDGFLKAKGTTLGADDGIGVACMLAIMMGEMKDLPNLELIFTVDEEEGLGGALGFEKGVLEANNMINLDSEEDNLVTIGCAGAIDFEISKRFELINLDKSLNFFKLNISRLLGGHSGTDINLYSRGNAISHLFSMLKRIVSNNELSLVKIQSGSASNAIPREAECIFATKLNEKKLKKIIETGKVNLEKIYNKFSYNLENINSVGVGLDFELSRKLINIFYSIHSGVLAQNEDVKELVETSINFGILKLENGNLIGKFMTRSFNDFAQEEIFQKYFNYFEIFNFDVKKTFEYCGWEPDLSSNLLKITQEIYLDLFNEEFKTNAVHAGLECGILKKNYPKFEIISIGPNILDAHSPNERVEIKSVDKVWKLLLEILKKLA